MILAIDPGCTHSAWVQMDSEYRPIQVGKSPNKQTLWHIKQLSFDTLVVEMVESYGMPVGKEVFDTCVWIGRFLQAAPDSSQGRRMYRKTVKLNLCGTTRAKDTNIRQALIDRFGVVGTKKSPGWFYGFKADVWQAHALGVSFLDGCETITEA